MQATSFVSATKLRRRDTISQAGLVRHQGVCMCASQRFAAPDRCSCLAFTAVLSTYGLPATTRDGKPAHAEPRADCAPVRRYTRERCIWKRRRRRQSCAGSRPTASSGRGTTAQTACARRWQRSTRRASCSCGCCGPSRGNSSRTRWASRCHRASQAPVRAALATHLLRSLVARFCLEGPTEMQG